MSDPTPLTGARRLRRLLETTDGVFAPLVLNAMMGRLAEAAGFPAGYVGGGALGFLTCATEANLGLQQMAQVALEIRTHCSLPLVLDGACGWGDPMHVRHTIRVAEAAGYAAIEIEDQLMPKRAHHHIGVEHLVPQALMEEKIAAAFEARRDPDFLIIARTNAARVTDMDDALARAEAYRKRGADLLMVMPGATRDSTRAAVRIATKLPQPLAWMVPAGGVGAIGMTVPDLHALGYKLVVDPGTPLFAMHRALRGTYAALRAGRADPLLEGGGEAEEKQIHATIDLAPMLEIERRSVER